MNDATTADAVGAAAADSSPGVEFPPLRNINSRALLQVYRNRFSLVGGSSMHTQVLVLVALAVMLWLFKGRYHGMQMYY